MTADDRIADRPREWRLDRFGRRSATRRRARSVVVVMVVAAVATSVVAVSRREGSYHRASDGRRLPPRHVVTVLTGETGGEDLAEDARVAVGALGAVTVVAAPGGRGHELRVDLTAAGGRELVRRDASGNAGQAVMRILRDVKARAETGMVLKGAGDPHGQRPSTPSGAVVDGAVRRFGEGVSL